MSRESMAKRASKKLIGKQNFFIGRIVNLQCRSYSPATSSKKNIIRLVAREQK